MSAPRPHDRLLSGDITEQELPGIGRRYDVRGADGGAISVVIHHSGRRDVYLLDADEPRASVSLTDSQARALGAILGGAYFKPAVVEEIEATIGGLLIDWVTLDDASPGVGRSIAELEVRTETGMTIVAVLREHVAMVAPGPAEVLRSGDRLVVVGRQEDLPRFRRHLVRA